LFIFYFKDDKRIVHKNKSYLAADDEMSPGQSRKKGILDVTGGQARDPSKEL